MTRIAEVDRPSPKALLPFKVVQHHNGWYLEYEASVTIPGGETRKLPFRITDDRAAQKVRELMQMFWALEDTHDTILKERDEAQIRLAAVVKENEKMQQKIDGQDARIKQLQSRK